MHSPAHIDALVVGAGAVGLAIARSLALRGRSVAVLEREDAPGLHTSSRNSSVIHAGIYYPQHSLKARLCVEGQALLYDYCDKRQISALRCGKLIVATDPTGEARLADMLSQGRLNGVRDLSLIGPGQVQEKEPQVRALAALSSPGTGVFDSHAFLQSLQQDIHGADGIISCHSCFRHARHDGNGFSVLVSDDSGEQHIRCDTLVNAAGLHAADVAGQIEGLATSCIPEIRLAKGNYFSLSGTPPCRSLIYPVPEPHGLGVHLTLDLAGKAHFGPDVEWVDTVDYRLSEHRKPQFVAAVQRYLPGIDPARLLPGWTGIRPKAFIDGAPINDFVIQGPDASGVPGLIQLFGIESPGLTASLAIAEYCLGLLERS